MSVSTAVQRLLGMATEHPALLVSVGGGVLAASALKEHGQQLEKEIMQNRIGSPAAKYTYAELDALDARTERIAQKLAFYKVATGGSSDIVDAVIQGTAKSVGTEGVKGVGGLLASAGRKIRDRVVLEPQRELILDEILVSDPTISAYESESPGESARAYASMRRFAPELSTDPNVVASYLREAAQTGGATNYMTIKQLAETEAAINRAQGRT